MTNAISYALITAAAVAAAKAGIPELLAPYADMIRDAATTLSQAGGR